VRKDGVQIKLIPLELGGLKTKIVQGQTQPLLGWMPAEHRPTPTVCFAKKQIMPAMFATLVYPYKAKQPDCESREIKTANDELWARAIHLPGENAEIVIAKKSQAIDILFDSKILRKVKTKAAGVVCREIEYNRTSSVGAWNLRSFNSDRLEFSTNENADLNFVQTKDALRFYNATDRAIEISISVPMKQTAVLAPRQWTTLSIDEN
jgi:hypothetical protein